MKKILLLLAESFGQGGLKNDKLFSARLSKMSHEFKTANISVDLIMYQKSRLPSNEFLSGYGHIILFLDPNFDSLEKEIQDLAKSKQLLILSNIDENIDFENLGVTEHLDAANFSQDMEAMKKIILDFASK